MGEKNKCIEFPHRSLKDTLPSSLLIDGLVVPEGWEVRPNGIFRTIKKQNEEGTTINSRKVAHFPMFITARFSNTDTK